MSPITISNHHYFSSSSSSSSSASSPPIRSDRVLTQLTHVCSSSYAASASSAAGTISNSPKSPISNLVKFDKICDYIPFVSTIMNVVNLILKAMNKYGSPVPAVKNHYYAHLEQKDWKRCAFLVVPVIGNIVVGLYDLCKRFTQKKNPEPVNNVEIDVRPTAEDYFKKLEEDDKRDAEQLQKRTDYFKELDDWASGAPIGDEGRSAAIERIKYARDNPFIDGNILDLSRLNLTSLPPLDLPYLEELNLSGNDFACPPIPSSLPNLQKLNLSSNRSVSVYLEKDSFPKLQSVDLSYNLLISFSLDLLPPSVQNLNLERNDSLAILLSENNCLPENLKKLNVTGTPLNGDRIPDNKYNCEVLK